MKGLGIIDLKPQVRRSGGHWGEFILTTEEEFDRMKRTYRNVLAVRDADFVGQLLVSGIVDDDRTIINECDSVAGNGTWALVAGSAATNVTVDNSNYINGSGSVNFDVDTTGTAPSIQNSDMTAVDLTDYSANSLFAWLYIPSGASNVASVDLRWGSGTGAYYARNITTTNEGVAFQNGWNLLRFDWDSSATTTGSPDITAINFLRVIVNLTAVLGTGTTDWRLDVVAARRGVIHDVIYYSRYGWQTSGGTYIENSTTSTDKLNVDTEEFELICKKLDYLIARSLSNRDDMKYAKQDYIDAVNRYVLMYPSEAKPLVNEYYHNSALGEELDSLPVSDS